MLLSLVVAAAVQAAAPGPVPPTPAVAVLQPQPAPATALVLPRNTLVRLMVVSEVNSRDHHPGTQFKLRVDEDVVVGGVTLVPTGATAVGEVTAVEGTGAAGKSGRIGARLLHLDVGGRQIPLSGERQANGGSGTGQVVGSVLAFGVLGLFMKGNNASIKAGEIINGYTLEDASFPRGTVSAR